MAASEQDKKDVHNLESLAHPLFPTYLASNETRYLRSGKNGRTLVSNVRMSIHAHGPGEWNTTS